MSSRDVRRLLARRAVGGSLAAANALIDGESDLNKKVELVLSLCRKKAPRRVVREILLRSIVSHPWCIHPQVPGSRELLRELFEYAEYPKPRRQSQTLYRGTAGIDSNCAGQGYFWANNRQQAVIYALSRAFARELANPIVVEARVSDDDVAVATEPDGDFPVQNALDDERHLEFIVIEEQKEVFVDVVTYEEAAINAPFYKKSVKAEFERRGEGESACVLLLERVDSWLARHRGLRSMSA